MTVEEKAREAAAETISVDGGTASDVLELARHHVVSFREGYLSGHTQGVKSAEGLVEALEKFKNEVKGMLYAHEGAIRADGGNTNWECLQLRINEAEKVLADWREGK